MRVLLTDSQYLLGGVDVDAGDGLSAFDPRNEPLGLSVGVIEYNVVATCIHDDVVLNKVDAVGNVGLNS